jgi:hypothetical protein
VRIPATKFLSDRVMLQKDIVDNGRSDRWENVQRIFSRVRVLGLLVCTRRIEAGSTVKVRDKEEE